MEEYKDISRGLKMLLDKAEEMGWNWEAYIEPGSRRTTTSSVALTAGLKKDTFQPTRENQ